MTLLPWVQHMIEQTGWRTACTAMGLMILIVLAPINLLLHKASRNTSRSLQPDGDAAPAAGKCKAGFHIVDPVWAATDWTLKGVRLRPRVSRGSRSAISAASTSGTRCRCIKPNSC